MDLIAEAACRFGGTEGKSTRQLANDPRIPNACVLTSSPDVDPVLPPRIRRGCEAAVTRWTNT